MAVVLTKAVDVPVVARMPPTAGVGRLRKIGLLGSHQASLADAPWDDPTWEFWGHSSSRGMYRRAPDRFFEMHEEHCWAQSNAKGERYLRWLASNTVPIFMWDRHPKVPASIKYPFAQVSFGMARKYFTNHAAYMMALALYEGCTHLGFFGINYGKQTSIGADCEYGIQRGSCEAWMFRAEGMGVQLVIPDGCDLLADPPGLYGRDSHDAQGLLVSAYTRRTWIKPDLPELMKMAATPKLPDGRRVPPADVIAAMTEEAAQTRPAWALGPSVPLPQIAEQSQPVVELAPTMTATDFPRAKKPNGKITHG